MHPRRYAYEHHGQTLQALFLDQHATIAPPLPKAGWLCESAGSSGRSWGWGLAGPLGASSERGTAVSRRSSGMWPGSGGRRSTKRSFMLPHNTTEPENRHRIHNQLSFIFTIRQQMVPGVVPCCAPELGAVRWTELRRKVTCVCDGDDGGTEEPCVRRWRLGECHRRHRWL
ncbi:hypothetical protein CCH79_00002705 [Gambusia affinis]|uniref:Uncharacterized protein n=1 Tax=Gambusia affinis TaxID=33528 RepID=A0A315W616_GAMAF|nr:hypothetical protein CCH79_00002705 [Gambusia affinis]